MSVHSKSSSLKKKKLLEAKKNQDSDEDFESSEEELDLTKECHPIGYFMNDRPEMINQMFSVIKGNKLRAMLPPILKDCDVEQLKLQCLDQLLGMSEKRISCILEGEVLDTSSESDVEDSDDYQSDNKSKSSEGSSGRSEDESESNSGSESDNRHRKGKRKAESNKEEKAKNAKLDVNAPAPEQGKTLLEILELEMRARAIRALLNQGGEPELPAKAATNEKAAPGGEVVDLTECEDDEAPVPVKAKTPETEIDKRVSKFEEVVEKSQTVEKPSQEESEKKQKLQAELELRNKLFKKKIYRTRQQRLENEEEEERKAAEERGGGGEEVPPAVIKQEPVEQDQEIVIEDPEEGEVSTSEDDGEVVLVKQEPDPEPEPEPTPAAPEPEEEESNERTLQSGEERISAMDGGNFVTDENLTAPEERAGEDEESAQGAAELSQEEEEEPKEAELEDISWRGRWLQKDGVQKLVKSSKIYAKVKKRMRDAERSRNKEESPALEETNSDSNTAPAAQVIEGSVHEYIQLTEGGQGEAERTQLNE